MRSDSASAPAGGAFDVVLVGLATGAALFGSFVLASGASTAVGLALAVLSVVFMAGLFVAMRRLEVVLWAFVPLLAVVRAEPAPVDLMAVALALALATRGELFRFPPPPLALVAAMLLFLSNLLALPYAPDVPRAIAHAGITIHLLILAFVTYQLAARGGTRVEVAFILTGVGLAVLSVMAFLPVPFAEALLYGGERVEGFFKDPNVFGPFVLPGMTLVLLGIGPRASLARVALFGVLAVPIVASASRGAFLGLAASVAAVGAVALYRRWHGVFAMSLGAAAVAVVVFVAVVLAGERSSHGLLQEQLYDRNRFAAQEVGMNYLADHPFSLGLGPGNAGEVLGTTNDIHDTYVRILVETGPLGFMALLALVWLGLSGLRVERALAAAWTAALVGFLADGFFIDIFHWRHFWLVIAMAAAYGAREGFARDRAAVLEPRTLARLTR